MIIKYLSEKFALSIDGSKNLLNGILWTVFLDIALMLPMGLLIFLTYLFMQSLNGMPLPNLYLFIALIIIVAMLIAYTQHKQYFYVFNSTYDSSTERRVELAESIRLLPLSFFERKDLSDLSATIMGDCTDLEHVFSHAIPQLTGSIIVLILVSIGLLCFNYKLAIALLWVIPVSFALVILSKKIQDKMSLIVFNSSRKVSENMQECLDSIKDIQSYNYQEDYFNRIEQSNADLQSSRIKGELVLGSFVTIAQMILKLGIVSLMIVGGNLYLNRQVDLFTLLAFIIAASAIFAPVEIALTYLAEIFASGVKINRMNDLKSKVLSEGEMDYDVDSYDISFENISFSYDNHEDVLKDISFVAKQNEITALIGPSGGGKSTVSKLAANFWNPNKGSVKLGKVDISKINNEKILENYSIVFQDVILFNDTIKENIRIGKKDASDEEILEVARLAKCDEFVQKLKNGYDTVIGENGALLSGGQRQRISIARALLKDAPIIILDEATSFLDVENESDIQEALNVLLRGKTVIIIAHRMRTIANADKLVVLNDGRIVETGSPDELYNAGGLFKRMVDIQNKSNEWKISSKKHQNEN